MIEHWTLLPNELEWLANKTGATRLGFAALLKYFQQEGCFPHSPHDVPATAISYLARQAGVAAAPNLQPVLTRPINWELICQQYDQMIKYATALRLGTAETEAILRRFTRNNLKHPIVNATDT